MRKGKPEKYLKPEPHTRCWSGITPLLSVLNLSVLIITLLPLAQFSVAELSAQTPQFALPTSLTELFPLKSGWFGIERTPSADRLLLIDSQFRTRSQMLWRDLAPLDFIELPGDTAGVLLAQPGNRTILYIVKTDPTPDLTPLWQFDGKGFDQIVGVKQTATSPLTVMLTGDSGIVGIGTNGEVAFQHRGRIKGVLLSTLDTNKLYFAENYGDQTFFCTLNLSDGTILSSTPIKGSGNVLLGYQSGVDRTILLLLSNPPTLYSIREESGGFQRQLPLPRFPDVILPVENSEAISLLYFSLPAPEVLEVGEENKRTALYYPSSVPFQSVLYDNHYIFLVGSDSVVVYDHEFNYLCRLPAVGGVRPRLITIDSLQGSYILTTENGSSTITVKSDPWGWFYPWQREIVIGIILLPLLLLGLILFLRYRMMRVMYTNIVRGADAAGFLVTSRNGKVLTINGTARRYIGIEGATPIGRHINFAFAAEHLQPVLERSRALLSYGQPYQTELNVSTDGSSRTLHFSGRPLYGRYGGTKGYIFMIQDITSIIEQDRLVNWASVAHHIAHEMKTPLGVIRTSAESLRHELSSLPDSSKGLTITGRLLRQSGRLREIVEDLLTVARTEEMKLVEVDLALLLSSLVDDMREFIPGMIMLTFEQKGESFRIRVDADQMTIALRNVIDNARQAIGDREGMIRVSVIATDDAIDMVVSDDGVGMSPTTLARLFQPYYTEKEGGSGIGTVIIKRVIEGHGGTVTVESEKGIGTTFRLQLPREEA